MRLLFFLFFPFCALADCTLTWPAAANAADYDIYYGATYETVAYVDTTASTSTTCTALSITPTDGYKFAVESSNATGNSSKRFVTWHKALLLLP